MNAAVSLFPSAQLLDKQHIDPTSVLVRIAIWHIRIETFNCRAFYFRINDSSRALFLQQHTHTVHRTVVSITIPAPVLLMLNGQVHCGTVADTTQLQGGNGAKMATWFRQTKIVLAACSGQKRASNTDSSVHSAMSG